MKIDLSKHMLMCMFTLSTLLLGACSDDSNPQPQVIEPAPENIITIDLPLTSTSQVPPQKSTGEGLGSLSLNLDSNTLSGHISFGELTVSAAHIHQGYAGEIGSAIVAFEASADASTMVLAETTLSEEQVERFRAGGYYINLHNDEFPDGFLRGQILPQDISVRIFSLSGAQQAPAIVSPSKGTGYITLDHTQSSVRVHAYAESANVFQAAHIHSGKFTENGAVVITLQQDPENSGHWYSDSQNIDADIFEQINDNNTYLNMHSDAYPDGELRGQIVEEMVKVFSFKLDSLQTDSPRTSAQTGKGNVALNLNTKQAELFVTTQDVEDATKANALNRESENNIATLLLNQDAENPQHFSLQAQLSDEEASSLIAQKWRLTVNSSEFPDGAVAGQILSNPSPSGLVLDADSMLSGSNTYSINFSGQPLGTAVIETLIEDGVVIINEITDAVPFGIVETLSVKVDALTMAPLAYTGTGVSGDRSIDINLTWNVNRVSGTTDMQEVQLPRSLPGHSVEQLGLFYTIQALPLVEGLTIPLSVYNGLDGSLLERELKVLRVTEISVPAGTYETFEVLLDGAEVNQIFYISTDKPRKLIQIGFDAFPITYELQP